MRSKILSQRSVPETISTESLMEDIGYRPLKDQIKMLTEAGKKLVDYRCQSTQQNYDGEVIDTSIFGKRYYDKIDIAELAKSHNETLEIARKAPRKGRELPKEKAQTPQKVQTEATELASDAAQN